MLEGKAKARTFATLSAHPVSILAIGDGFLVSAHGKPFVSGPGFVETQQFLLLDGEGREIASFPAPDARFLNGMVRHAGGTVLIADSIAATIWQVDPKARSMRPWLRDEALAQDPAVKDFKPGANGLKRQGDLLLISNSSRGAITKVAIGGDGNPAGAVTELAKVGAIDDFVVGPQGEIIFATHGAKLQRRAADGTTTTLLESGCDGCTAVAFVKDGSGADALLILTTGGFSEGRKDPARVLRLPYRNSR
jgi:sugar lactone lactonase YvrE